MTAQVRIRDSAKPTDIILIRERKFNQKIGEQHKIIAKITIMQKKKKRLTGKNYL